LDRAGDGLLELGLLGRRRFDAGAAFKGVVACDELAVENTGAEEHLEEDGLGEVVMTVRIIRGGGEGLAEVGDGLGVFEVEEVVEAAADKGVLSG
jgi:hypothetical protein